MSEHREAFLVDTDGIKRCVLEDQAEINVPYSGVNTTMRSENRTLTFVKPLALGYTTCKLVQYDYIVT